MKIGEVFAVGEEEDVVDVLVAPLGDGVLGWEDDVVGGRGREVDEFALA